jgi:hypothetical protein
MLMTEFVVLIEVEKIVRGPSMAIGNRVRAYGL